LTHSRPEIRIPWEWKIVKIQLAEAPLRQTRHLQPAVGMWPSRQPLDPHWDAPSTLRTGGTSS